MICISHDPQSDHGTWIPLYPQITFILHGRRWIYIHRILIATSSSSLCLPVDSGPLVEQRSSHAGGILDSVLPYSTRPRLASAAVTRGTFFVLLASCVCSHPPAHALTNAYYVESQ